MNHIVFTMGSSFFRTHTQQTAKKSILQYQKKLIEQHYDFLKCRIEKNVLKCIGKVHSADFLNDYQIEIICVAGVEPYCKIVEPNDIEACNKIHMYEDHSLCLHYPQDMKWSGWTKIYKYTIPWVIEWIHYYELYLVNGKVWEGPESPVHFTEQDKNKDQDFEE